MATNLSFAEWVTVFAGDEKLTTALLDRLADHATVITTKGQELSHAQTAREGRSTMSRRRGRTPVTPGRDADTPGGCERFRGPSV